VILEIALRFFLIRLSVLFFGFYAQAYANPFILGLYGDLGISIVVSLACLYVEFLVVNWFYKKQLPPKRLFLSFLFANGITFLPTQLLSTVLGPLAEALPLYLEPILYRRYLGRHDIQLHDLNKKVIIANLISFFVGWLALFAIVGLSSI
jgi:hypothetical protein